MSGLLKLLEALKPVDEDVVKRIVQAVGIAADKMDLASLGKDLAVLRARGLYACEMSSSRKVAPTQRKRHAESVRSHADKLLSALSPAHEFDTRVWFLSLFCRRQHDKGPKAIGELLLSLRFLIHDADQIISEANAEIRQGGKAKKPLESPPPLDSLGSLFSRYNPPDTVSWTIAWELAPIFKNHFCKNATASTPSEASKDRTPRGPFVRFVQAVQQNLFVFPGQDAVSPHTIASALARTKSQRLAWTKSRRTRSSH